MSQLMSLTKDEAMTKLRNLKAKAQRYEAQATRAAELSINSGATVAGGLTAGVLAYKMPYLGGFKEARSDALLGAGMVALSVGLTTMGRKGIEPLAHYGAGLLAVAAARESAKAMYEAEKAKGKPVSPPLI